ncbi:MAG: RtcB family protein [Pseudonocardiales bacterium]|nr:RtcB family protein [Pseudonocardiales bacterium]
MVSGTFGPWFKSAEVTRNSYRTAGLQLPSQLHHQGTPLRQGCLAARKGAIDASEGTPGLIPGSMGAASYVVTGKWKPSRAQLLAPWRRPGTLAFGGSETVHSGRHTLHQIVNVKGD